MKERIVEERKTKYGKRIVKQLKGKIIVEKIKEDKSKVVKKKQQHGFTPSFFLQETLVFHVP